MSGKKESHGYLRLHEILNKPDWEHLFLFWEVPVPKQALVLNKDAFPPNLLKINAVVNAYYVLIQNNVLLSSQMVEDLVAVKNHVEEELYPYLKGAALSTQEDIMVVGMLENFRVFCESVEAR